MRASRIMRRGHEKKGMKIHIKNLKARIKELRDAGMQAFIAGYMAAKKEANEGQGSNPADSGGGPIIVPAGHLPSLDEPTPPRPPAIIPTSTSA